VSNQRSRSSYPRCGIEEDDMKNMKRRDFIVLGGAGFLSACGSNGGSNTPSPTPPPATASKSPPPTPPPAAALKSPPLTPAAPPPPSPPVSPPNGSNPIAAENALAGVSDWVLTKPDSSNRICDYERERWITGLGVRQHNDLILISRNLPVRIVWRRRRIT
jgi:hypothetical protein